MHVRDHCCPRSTLKERTDDERVIDPGGRGRPGEFDSGFFTDPDEGLVNGPVGSAHEPAHPIGDVDLAPREVDAPRPV